MNANLAERSSDDLIADNPTDELHQVEPEPSAMEIPEPAEPDNAKENRGVLDGLKVIGLA
jgi:hypothetical protein